MSHQRGQPNTLSDLCQVQRFALSKWTGHIVTFLIIYMHNHWALEFKRKPALCQQNHAILLFFLLYCFARHLQLNEMLGLFSTSILYFSLLFIYDHILSVRPVLTPVSQALCMYPWCQRSQYVLWQQTFASRRTQIHHSGAPLGPSLPPFLCCFSPSPPVFFSHPLSHPPVSHSFRYSPIQKKDGRHCLPFLSLSRNPMDCAFIFPPLRNFQNVDRQMSLWIHTRM